MERPPLPPNNRTSGVPTTRTVEGAHRIDLLTAICLVVSFNDIGSHLMPSSYTLGKHFEEFVQAQLASGRYNNASEVLRDALRLMEERERRLAALDTAISRGITDIEAGRLHDADSVFDELEAKYEQMVTERQEP
jgi:antitoxin ParD1/3/4